MLAKWRARATAKERAMKEKAKKGKKAKVALKDLEVGKVKGGMAAEEDPKGGYLKAKVPEVFGPRSPTAPLGNKFGGGFSKH